MKKKLKKSVIISCIVFIFIAVIIVVFFANKKNTTGPIIKINGNYSASKSFIIEPSVDNSLEITSDSQAHNFVFSEDSFKTGKISIGSRKTKKINFKTTTLGVYTLSCSVPGHKEKGEVWTIAVNPKSPASKPEAPGSRGIEAVINQGSVEPNMFTIIYEPKLAINFTLRVNDYQNHNFIFSDSSLGVGDIKLGSKEVKLSTFYTAIPGEYEFHCTIPGHEKETGKIVVINTNNTVNTDNN